MMMIKSNINSKWPDLAERTYDSLGDICPIFKRQELQLKASSTALNNEGYSLVYHEEINTKVFK